MSEATLELQMQVVAMRGEGFSLREIGRELDLSRMKVSRILEAAEFAPAAPPPDDDDLDDDGEDCDGDPLILSVLSADDLVLLGVSAADFAGQRGNVLHAYRMRGLAGTPHGQTARAQLSGSAWARWLLKQSGASDRVGVDGPVPQHVRDARIVELRRSGWTLDQIAAEVGMGSKGAVSNALARIARELNGSEVD